MVLIAVLAVAIAPASGVAGHGQRPDLSVSKGSVGVKDGAIKGTFVVANDGKARAGRSSVSLTAKASGKNYPLKRYRLGALGSGASHTVKVNLSVPPELPNGKVKLRACADDKGKLRESAERNNCGKVGKFQLGGEGPPADPGASAPTDPISFQKNKVFTLNSTETDYWVYVPKSYDETHATPTTLFVWLHGCGGESSGDIYNVSPGGSQDWISIAVGGREDDCWNPDADQSKVLAAIANMKTHFNVNPRSVIFGGYSSGGDLAYRLAFYNSSSFAGVLAENTSPFRDTGSTQEQSLAAATTKFHVVHLAHLQDGTYPIDGVRAETDAMINAGFPLKRVEREGTHYDNPGQVRNGKALPGTDADVQKYLLPHIDDGWLAPPQ